MAKAQLSLHTTGARRAELEEIQAHVAPPPEGRWFPVPHGRVLSAVKDALDVAGFSVESQQFGLSHESNRFFGVMDLTARLAQGVTLAVGIRNSVDKTYPIGFCAGLRTFVCSNLAFSSELLVTRKHSRHGEARFIGDIMEGVTRLTHFRAIEEQRIAHLQQLELTDDRADALILRSYEVGIISTPQLPKVIGEWREPSFEDFRPRTAWSLISAFTTVMRDKAETQPQKHVVATMRLNALIAPNFN